MKTWDLVYQILGHQSQLLKAHFTYFLFLMDWGKKDTHTHTGGVRRGNKVVRKKRMFLKHLDLNSNLGFATFKL